MNAVVVFAQAEFWLLTIISPDEACSLFYFNGPIIFHYGNFRISEYTLISSCEWEDENSEIRCI